MGCVNKASKEFKDLAARHDLAANQLELYTHKYWLQTGNETLFPTDVYIQAQMGNTHYQESGENVRRLWQMRYSSPIECGNIHVLNAAKREASKYFPKGALFSYRNANGDLVLSVQRPVEKANYSKDSFFDDMDSMNPKDVKTYNLGIKENYSYGIGKVQELFNKFNTDRTSRDLADRVFNIAKNLGLNITFNESLPFGTIGNTKNNNTITYKKSFFERATMDSKKAPILLHEVIHALSMYALSNQTLNWKRPKELQQFRTEINSLYQDLKNNPILKGERGIVDVNEFVAELGNPVFRNKIKELDKQNKEKKSFWSRVLDAFKSLLGLHTSNSYYQRSMNALDKALDAFDLDTYMRYNGIKNTLRKGYNEKEWDFRTLSDDKLKTKINDYFDSKVYDDELLSFKRRAIANGTFMKAPNGKSTNLNERQWLQVRTKAFKNWFGDWENDPKNASKVVDENGEPLVVYHGSPKQFSIFDKSKNKKGQWQNVDGSLIDFDTNNTFFFSDNKAVAKSYSFLNKLTGKEISNSGINTINKYLESIKYLNNLTINDNIEKYTNTIEDAIKDIGTYRDTTIYKALKKENINGTLTIVNGKLVLKSNFLEGFKYQVLPDRFFEDAINSIKTVLDKRIKSYSKPRTDWDGTPIPVVDLNKNVYAVFLNIRNPFAYNYKGANINGKYKEKYPIEYINARQVAKAIKEGNDGVIYNNISDPYLANNYGIFNPNQVKSATDNIGTFYTDNNEIYNYELSKDLIYSLSGKDLKDELSLIKQESADYDLVNHIEEEKKHSGKAIPHDFTFNDGTVVKAPFMPNAQQIDALNAMSDFIKSRETSMTLSGYAGTGKTSLMEMIAKKCQKQNKPVMFCATTNKAAAVLNERVSKAGFKAETLNKVFGISVEIDPNSKTYNARNLVNNLKDIDILPNTTIIIDEASMINEENYRILNDIARNKGLKIIYVGDEAQLAPVNEEQISKVFRNGDGKVVTLTQVERTADNAILKEATDIREGKPLSGETSFNSKGEGVAYILPQHTEAVNDVIEKYIKGLKKDPNYFRILAYTNKAVSNYNTQVRNLLGYTSSIPNIGEPMTGYNNWGYTYDRKKKKGTYRFINSESYKVTKVDKPKQVYTKLDNGTSISMQAIPITLEDSLGKKDTFNFMDIKNNSQNRQAAMLLAEEKKRLWADTKKVVGMQAKIALYQKINTIDSFLFVNDNIEDNDHNLLQAKTIDFGYAMTVHKSQGSTFTNVLMDDVDISRVGITKSNNIEAVNFEAPAEVDMSKMELKNEEDVDLGDLSGAEETPTQQPDQVANLKQQLEYVGVSRATDTVTIISNHVKKEGSPLHPEKTIKEDNLRSNSKQENNESNNTGNAETSARNQQTSNGGLLAESQARIKRGNGNLRESQKQGVLTEENIDQRNREDRETLEKFAKEQGKWAEDVDTKLEKKYGGKIGHGSEAWIYRKDNNTVIKSRSFTGYDTISDALRSIELHNELFPETAMKVVGFGNGDGEFSVIVEQPFIEGSYASNEEIEKFIKDRFNADKDNTVIGNTSYKTDKYLLQDLKPQNVIVRIVDGKRQLNVIDGDFYDNPSAIKGTEPSETQRVSLPSYEYFNDLYEDTPVDAAWKIPYLKELDAQLSGEKSEEENQNILNQMNTVLEATSKEEYSQKVMESKVNKVDKTLDEYDKFTKQLDNLMGEQMIYTDTESATLDELDVPHLEATEIRHIGELIGNAISDMITDLQKEKGLAEKWFPAIKTRIDFQTASRKKIVEALGINNLVTRAREMFNSEVVSWDDINHSFQMDLIYDNWDAMMSLAADTFAFNEGFGITKDYGDGHFTTTDTAKVDWNNFNDYSNDPDVVGEEGGKDDQEHWQIEQRTIDILNSMSALVRQGLHECYLLDKDGNKEISKWGIPERVNPREATNSILRWTQGTLSLDDMIKKLSDKQKSNTWLSQLITRLSDKSGKETDFQSQFYGVFQKHFQLYSIIRFEDGKYSSMTVNSHPALTDVMNTITSQFKMGEHPLFGKEGKINAKLLGNDENTVGKNAAFNLHKAYAEVSEVNKSLQKGNALDEEMSKTISDNITKIGNVLGFKIDKNMLSDVINKENIKKWSDALRYLTTDLDKVFAKQRKGELKSYDPFKFGGDNNIGGTLRNFLTPITNKLEDTAINAFYDSGKMYQSYVTPSFMTKLFNKFHQEGKAFEDFIMNEYGSSEWFRFNPENPEINRGWRNDWLKKLATDENARKVFDHKVELNFNKHNYMRNMSDTEYTLSLITEYFSESAKREDQTPSWYRVPMQSNKPSSEFIKFYSYRGSEYKQHITNRLYGIFLQELSRIQTVRMRNMSKKDAGFIKNFDTNGRKFNFLPVLNAYLENDALSITRRNILRNEDDTLSYDNARFASLLQKKLNGEEELTSDEETLLSNLANRVIKQSMENRVQSILDSWENNGILDAAKNIKDIYPSELSDEDASSWTREQVENFLWNDALASKNILQLTLSDISFYKDTEDLQKRLAQLHAPGVRGNIFATDYDGNRVSDGKYRTFILQDFDSFKSSIIANISEVFDRKITNAPEQDKPAMIALKESLVGKDGKYTKINVTDAQGYSSPSSYRKKALIFGKWSKEAEGIYQKLLKGEYTYTDLETAFQPLKPFVYSKLTKDMGVEDAPIHSMQVPFQAKNAEYLLIMADAILKGESLSRPNLLRAVYRVMEDSEKLMPTKGIDTVQFESSIKSGLQGKMNIHQFREMQGGEEAAYTFMKNQIFKEEYDQTTGERLYRDYNTDTFVHEASYDDYCLQQEVPEHFKEHSQAHGSQIRMITPSDLDLYTTDEKGNQVDNYYEWTEPNGIKRRVKADEFRKEYEQTIADNIKESISNLEKELHFNSEDKRERNIALSKILQKEILSSPRYGIDLAQACAIDKETGEFRIPKGDPIQAKKIEQLINSILKNRVNKQKIAGGPIVQVSNFGISKQLHIRFNDRQGNLMPMEEEYNPSKHNGQSYKDYIKEHQGGIAYFEVFVPIWHNELFDKFANPDGTINVDAINAVDPELLKMVSYRIPTEDKYSCAPMKVVGFMPREAGDAIMLPYELTEIDDSDFDVDKRYVMRKDIPIKEKNSDDYVDELEERGKQLYKSILKEEPASGYVERTVDELLRNPKKFNTDSPFRRALYAERQNLAYYTDTPVAGRRYRDNKIIDMTYAVLTNQMTADKILNPGGFDAPKKMGYMVAAYKNPANKGISWDALEGMSIDELKNLSYTDKDLTFADTQVQFYKQNSAAASLIGVFAVNKVAHATLEGNDILLDVSEICGDTPFTIAVNLKKDSKTGKSHIIGGTTFEGRMQIDQKYDQEGTLIGKTLGSLVSASADAVKDPILNLMNINMTTAGMLNTMLRLGMPFNDAALFLSQDVIERLLGQFNRENLVSYAPLNGIIEDWLDKYRAKYDITDSSTINTEALTKEELIEGLTTDEHEAIDYKVLLAFQKLRALTDAMRNPTYITRFNSISSAVGPLIIDNLIMEHKMEQFLDVNAEDGTHFYTSDGTPVDAKTIFDNHPILQQFSRTVGIAKSMFSDMPAGSKGFRDLLANLPVDIANKMYADKKLLDSFSNFYQSYLLIQSGVVDPKHLHDFVKVFPTWYSNHIKDKDHQDNALVQAIRVNVSKKTGRPYLQINITGMDEQQKEMLRSAWTDLYKKGKSGKQLATWLFEYSFFRAGIGFSPKTFMALVPSYVKQHLKNENTGATYLDTYRNFPEVVPDMVIDQFIRNNWDNNKLVPWKGGKDSHYNIDVKHGLLTVYREEEKAALGDTSYIKTKVGKETYLWKREEGNNVNGNIVFKPIKPLGNNGEYLEMNTSWIDKPLYDTLSEESKPTDEKTDTTDVQQEASELKTESPQETSTEEIPNTSLVSKTEKVKNLSSFADLVMGQNASVGKDISKEEALKRSEKMKSNPELYGKFFQNVFKQKGLDLSVEEAIEEFKKYC